MVGMLNPGSEKSIPSPWEGFLISPSPNPSGKSKLVGVTETLTPTPQEILIPSEVGLWIFSGNAQSARD